MSVLIWQTPSGKWSAIATPPNAPDGVSMSPIECHGFTFENDARAALRARVDKWRQALRDRHAEQLARDRAVVEEW